MKYGKIMRLASMSLSFVLAVSAFAGVPAVSKAEAKQISGDSAVFVAAGIQGNLYSVGTGAETLEDTGDTGSGTSGEGTQTGGESGSTESGGGNSGTESGGETGETVEGETPENPDQTKTLESIQAEKKDIQYFTGDEISWDDLEVTAVYSDKSTEKLAAKTEEKPDGYELDKEGLDTSKAGEYEVTITYKEKTATIKITIVKPAKLQEIRAQKTKTVYTQDDEISWDDLTVTAVYDDSTIKTISRDAEGLTIASCDKEVLGEQKILISYTEKGETKTTEITITIKNVLSKITATKKQKTYTVNDTLNLDDLVVTAHYNDNKRSKVLDKEDYKTNAADLRLAPSGTKKLQITYTEDGVTKECTVKLTVNVPEVPVKNGVRTADIRDFGALANDIYTDKAAIQDALDVSTADGVPLVVYVPAGTYYIGGPLYIHSNTTIKMENNAVIRRNSKGENGDSGRQGVEHNMLKAASSGTTTNKVGGYDNAENIVIEGGTWDGGDIKQAVTTSNVINIGHAKNVIIRNATIKNCHGSHLIEFAGVKNAEVYGCTFTGFRYEKDGVDSEAIQLDICDADWNAAYKADKKECDTIYIHDNTFIDYPVAVGNHHALEKHHNKNITVKNNNIRHTQGGYQGIYLFGCDSSTVSGNTISGFENGIKMEQSTGVVLDKNNISNCDYGIVSTVGSTGKITSNTISDTVYGGIFAYNGTKLTSVSKNKLKNTVTNTSTAKDGGGRGAIAVRGYGSEVKEIVSNTVDTNKWYGVYADTGAQVKKINKNTISNTKKSGIYVNNTKVKVTVKSNKLKSVGSNAIKIANKTYVKQSYTFAPKVKKLKIEEGYMNITAANLKQVELKFNKKSYKKSTKKKKYTLNFKAYGKKVKSTSVLFTDTNKNVVTKVVK